MTKTATASCFCGTVQIEVPLEAPGLVDTFVCNCTDCRKITASMFASNFIVTDKSMKHLRGESSLSQYGQSETIASGNTMTNFFCKNCGTLMYRRSSGWPGLSIPRIGTIDDLSVQEGALKPRIEQFIESRVAWFKGAEGVDEAVKGQYPFGE